MNLKTWSLGVLALALVWPCVVSAEVLTVDETAVPIRVDGHLGDWPSSRMILLNQPSQIVSGRSYWGNAEDFNGRVFLSYDSLFLYVAAIVQKRGDVVNSNDKLSLWNGDCLELYLSTHSNPKDLKRLSGGEYRIGFSPGTRCGNPQMFCFNKNKDIGGGRVIARPTNRGYILEACVPLSFFAGLNLGPGKTSAFNVALDEGGSVSGNRILQLDLSGQPLSWEHPAYWSVLQWIGKDEVSVPENHVEDFYAHLVQDGTRGTNYLGFKNFLGKVVDPKGKPLAGAKVSTWPKSKEVMTDSNGNFKLEHIKVYDKTVFYGRLDGYASSLCPRPSKVGAVAITLCPLPNDLDGSGIQKGALFCGQSVRLPSYSSLDTVTGGTQDWVKPLQLNLLRLCGTEGAGRLQDTEFQILDKFVAYARQVGVEPVIEAPIRRENPGRIADWVRYCNIEKKYGVRFWTVGDEPDMDNGQGGDSKYSVYDYINDFRVIYNAMKTTDPSILVQGPELACKYTEGENDWITPFVQYNGDILNIVSIHHYAALTPEQCTAKTLQADIRSEPILFRSLRDKISGNSDVYLPLVVTGGNTCREAVSIKGADDAGPQGFWAALWTTDELGIALKERLGMHWFSYLKGSGGLDVLTEAGPRPAYWALKLFGTLMSGNMIAAQIQQADTSVYATQDAKSKDVTLLIVYKGDRYYRPKIMLNGKDADLMVDAGLNQRVDYEVPSYSISFLKIKADNSPGQVVRYTRKLAESGKEPETLVLKPW